MANQPFLVWVVLSAFLGVGPAAVLAQSPVASSNVNMVSGTKLGTGDPFLTKQNEPSIAVSSLNPAHLLGGSNDSRLIDFSIMSDIPGENTADSWVSVYKSTDGGRTWRSMPLPGCPLDIPSCNVPASPAKGYQYASDPTVRSGPYGTFFYSYIAGNRGDNAPGIVAVQRFIDRNDNLRVSDDPFTADVVNVIARGNSGQFKDKPWNAVDQPGRPWNTGKSCLLPGRTSSVPAFSVYVAYANFVGNDPTNPHPQIYVARSHDCGATFEKETKASASVATNQGATIAVDPTNGYVYVAWRQFYTTSNGTPDGIYIARSTDGGKSWDRAVKIADIAAFDQGPSSATRFRSNALPTIAVSVDANNVSRVHVAWAERFKGPVGPAGTVRGARIMLATSRDGGNTWPSITPIDGPGASPNNEFNSYGLGHQFQPSLAFAAGKLTAIWLDQRNDHTVSVLQCPTGTCTSIKQYVEKLKPMTDSITNQVADSLDKVFSDWVNDAGLKRRHTLDVYGAQAAPSDSPVFTSFRVSSYARGTLPNPPGSCGPNLRCPSGPIRQLEFNAPNLPIYVNYTASFIGDYTDLGVRQFVPTPEDSAVPFKFNNTQNANETFHPTWTDNRDVRAPRDGNWSSYRPVRVLAPDGKSIVVNPAPCVPGKENIKNQNVYTARIGDGLNAFALVNSKLLLPAPGRRFTLVLQNNSPNSKTYRLDGQTQISGATVCFDSACTRRTLDVQVAAYSSASRTAWVSSATNSKARADIRVTDTAAPLANLLSTIILNPDPAGAFVTNTTGGGDVVNNDMTELDNRAIRNTELTNNELTNTELTNNELTNNELTNNELTNNELTNNELTNTELTNNELTNNELTNTELTNTELTNTELTNTELTNNELTNTELTNNELTNTELTNGSLSDATFVVTNKGNTDGVLNVKSIIKGAAGQSLPPGYVLQLVVHKLYRTPSAKSCNFTWRTQDVVLANIAQPSAAAIDPNLGIPNLNPDEWNANVPMAVNDVVRVTYRILSKTGSALSANEFAAYNVKTVAVGADTTTIQTPLLIQPADLPVGTYGSPYQGIAGYQLAAAGGAPAPAIKNWSATGLPSGLSISPGGVISGTPLQTGTFTVLATVADGVQTDIQKFLLTVNKATLTVTAGSASRVFGAADPLILPNITGFVSPDSASIVAGLACGAIATPSSPVGLYPTRCSGGVATNYAFNYVDGTLTINPAPLTVTALNASRFYGAANPPLTFQFSVSNPLLTTQPTCTTTATAISPVVAGGYPITCSGAVGANYLISYVGGTLTINPAPLTVTAEDKSKTYGTANPALTFSYSPASPADVTAPSCTTTATTTSPVVAGGYPIICSGAIASNYSISYVAGTLTINPAPLTITAVSASKVYGTANPALTFSYSPVNPVDVTAPACTTTATTTSPVVAGGYPITCSGAVAGNYSVSYVAGTLTINPAPLTITAVSASKVYGTANPALTFTYSPANPVDVTAPACTTTATTTSPVVAGGYPITCSGAVAPNYAVTYVDGTLTINQAALTITAVSASRVFGTANPALTFSYSPANPVDVTAPTCTTTATTTSPVVAGGYPITCSGAVAPNYAVTYVDGTLTITQATFTITADNKSKVYGAALPLLTFSPALPGGSTPPACSTAATAASGTGNYPITCSGASSTNYSFNYVNGTLSVTAASLTITAPSLSIAWGTPIPALTPTFTTLVAGDTAASLGAGFTCTTTATATSAAAAYPTNCSGAVSNNYTISYVSGVLTITVATMILDAPTASMSSARAYHTATTLLDGTVLIAGGSDSKGPLNTALTYNPVTNTYTAVSGGLKNRISGHTATRLANGKVLLAGGGNSSGEVYDPATRTTTSIGGLSQRSFHTATLLSDGRVLLAGGAGQNGSANNSAVIYDPAANTFTATGNMNSTRQRHAAVLLGDGRVLILGGVNSSGAYLNTAEIYSPATGSFTAVAQPMQSARANHQALRLADGTVLIMGGASSAAGAALGANELFNGQTFSTATALNFTARQRFTATPRADGAIAVIGGANGTTTLGSTQVFAGGFTNGPAMRQARSSHATTVLSDGRLFVTGGLDASGAPIATTEAYKLQQ